MDTQIKKKVKYLVEIEVVGDGDIFNTDLVRSITSHGDDRVILENCYTANFIQLIENQNLCGGGCLFNFVSQQ